MSTPRVHYPWYKKEDTDAFFALFQNNIANFVIIAISMLGMGSLLKSSSARCCRTQRWR